MRSRSGSETGNVVRKTNNDASPEPRLANHASSDVRAESQLEQEAAQALQSYRARLNEVEAAEAALREAVRAEQAIARDLDAPARLPHSAANRVRLLAEYRDALHQLATVYSVHDAAQMHLNAARERYRILGAQLGFFPKV